MIENPDFEQEYYSRTAISIYKIGQDSIILTKWLPDYDSSFYEKTNYYDLMSILICFENDIQVNHFIKNNT